MAEGGAGPLWAAQIAIEVGTPQVLVPPHPGIAAAMGLLATDMVYEYVATTYQRLSKLDAQALKRRFEELEELALAQLRDDGMPEDKIVVQRIAECRYLGQGYELRVDAPSGAIDDGWVESVRRDFHDIHEREYSRRFEEQDIEIPNIRVRGIGLMPDLAAPEIEAAGESPTLRCATRAKRGSASTARWSSSRPSTTTVTRCAPGTGWWGLRSSRSTTPRR